MTITTTLSKIRAENPCEQGYKKLVKYLGGVNRYGKNTPIPFSVIAESNGLDDALWCMRSAPEYEKEWRLYAVWCARQVQHLMTDERSLIALDIAEGYALGNNTLTELETAWDNAWDAALEGAQASARAAARTAWNNAWDAARTARTATLDAALGVDRDAIKSNQLVKFLEVVA
jgi:hypothetical protein